MSRLREGRGGQGGSASARGVGRGHSHPPEGPRGRAGVRVLRPQRPRTGALGQRGLSEGVGSGRVGWKTAWSCRQSLREVDFGVVWLVFSIMAFLLNVGKEGF